jgi:hypothetical protein
MKSPAEAPSADQDGFIAALNELIAPLGWDLHSFRREEEMVGLVALQRDPFCERIIWVYDTKRSFVRCLAFGRGTVPAEREAAIIELCARINDGLIFGCAEYGFANRTFAFRDSVPVVGHSELKDALSDLTGRLLKLGARNWPAIAAVLGGASATEAIAHAHNPQAEGRAHLQSN